MGIQATHFIRGEEMDTISSIRIVGRLFVLTTMFLLSYGLFAIASQSTKAPQETMHSETETVTPIYDTATFGLG